MANATNWSRAQLDEKLSRIRSSPKLQSQQQSAVVLSAVEDTLKDQKSDFTPTAYFAALLSLLNQHVSSANGIVNKDVSTAIVYLLELVTPHVPTPLLRSKFSAILTSLSPALSLADADAPFLRSSIGCLVSLLVVQDGASWALPQSQMGPRKALGGLLSLAIDHRPKVRKRAQEGLATVLKNPPPTPSLEHPAADMCAETSLRTFQELAVTMENVRKSKRGDDLQRHEPMLIHTMQLIKAIASASGGWPSRSLDSLCEVLFTVARSKGEYLTMAAFEVFEAILGGMASQTEFEKLHRLLESVIELQPSQNDTQLLPPWLAVLSRGYDISAQLEPDETFQKLPTIFHTIVTFLASSSYNIRVSASECLISLLVNCVPPNVILEPSVYDEKTSEKLAGHLMSLLTVKYQGSWMEVFKILEIAFDAFRWQSSRYFSEIVATVGELRSDDSFTGKQQADEVLKHAIAAMGPETVLDILPLNLAKPKAGTPGRAWMLPLLHDSVANTNLSHFRRELLPLSETMYQRVLDRGGKEASMETKIFETVVQQVWATLPGYCDHPLDVCESFDQEFAEMLAKLLYQQPEMRATISKSLQTLVDSMKVIANVEGEDDLLLQGRISKELAQQSVKHLSTFAPNLLAILFNVYTETLQQSRGPILSCIDSYLSIMTHADLSDTFNRVAETLESCIKEEMAQKDAQKAASQNKSQKQAKDAKSLMSHSLMDIVVVLALYLPRDSFHSLFNLAAVIISQNKDAQLQKKAYKLIPRLALSESGRQALEERNQDLCQLVLNNSNMLLAPAKKDRLGALAEILKHLPSDSLHLVPSILPEVILCTREMNEKTRKMAFDLIVDMGKKMQAGGTIMSSKINDEQAATTSSTSATLDEFFVMLSAGLAGASPLLTCASITAVSRALFEFHQKISENMILELLSTMDLFLKSPTREVVRSVFGFVKVCIISLPVSVIEPRLGTLIPALMSWSHEHKGHFRVKVKNILERMIRRFGFDVIDRNCPEEDRKLITNIRKTRERQKRKKAAAIEEEDAEGTAVNNVATKAQFESEFDRAIYGSDDSDAGSSPDEENAGGVELKGPRSTSKRKEAGDSMYILEDDDEPLDLLDRKSLARISSSRPMKTRQPPSEKHHAKAKKNLDGKLVLGDDEDDGDDAELMGENGKEPGDGTLEGGINAYVDAIRGKDAARRGLRGKLKFSNRRSKDPSQDEDGGMDVDPANDRGKKAPGHLAPTASRAGSTASRSFRSGRGGGPAIKTGFAKSKMQRRGLGMGKTREGRIAKNVNSRGSHKRG